MCHFKFTPNILTIIFIAKHALDSNAKTAINASISCVEFRYSLHCTKLRLSNAIYVIFLSSLVHQGKPAQMCAPAQAYYASAHCTVQSKAAPPLLSL